MVPDGNQIREVDMTQIGNVGTTKIFENDKVIMWEFVLEPGAETPMHRHEHPEHVGQPEGEREQQSRDEVVTEHPKQEVEHAQPGVGVDGQQHAPGQQRPEHAGAPADGEQGMLAGSQGRQVYPLRRCLWAGYGVGL